MQHLTSRDMVKRWLGFAGFVGMAAGDSHCSLVLRCPLVELVQPRCRCEACKLFGVEV